MCSSTGSISSRASTGSRALISSMEPLRSANSTVSCLRSPPGTVGVRVLSARCRGVGDSGGAVGDGTPCGGGGGAWGGAAGGGHGRGRGARGRPAAAADLAPGRGPGPAAGAGGGERPAALAAEPRPFAVVGLAVRAAHRGVSGQGSGGDPVRGERRSACG